jgi:uncharacterized protein (TIGR00369 family)
MSSDFDPGSVDPRLVETIVRKGIPHARELGIGVVEIGPGRTTLSLPWQERLVGDPETGVLAGGAVTTLIDTVCGMAVFAALRRLVAIATLDLRIDYLKPAAARSELLATAECFKLTRHIAFVRGTAYLRETPADLVATCAGAFMIGSSDTPPITWAAPQARP